MPDAKQVPLGGLSGGAQKALTLRHRQLARQEAEAMGDAPAKPASAPAKPPISFTTGPRKQTPAQAAQLAELLRARARP